MASANDKKIKELLSSIEAKKNELGTRPKFILNTNGILRLEADSSLGSGVNINTINTIDRCVSLATRLLQERNFVEDACKELEVPMQSNEQMKFIDNAMEDLKNRVKLIKWELEKKKLTAMEKKLKDLRSEDAKTADALSEIMDSLK